MKSDKKTNKKRRKDNKTLNQKREKRGRKNFDKKVIKEKERKIKVLAFVFKARRDDHPPSSRLGV
jgi:hypothetical protein